MHPNPRRILPVLAILAVGAGLYWWYGARASAETNELGASGTIEATDITVASELAGRIVSLNMAEGDRVSAGQALVTLDDSLLMAQRAQAQAAFEAAQNAAKAAAANLALLKAGASDEQLAVAQTAVDRAQASADAAQSAYDALPAAAQSGSQGKTLKQQLDIALATLDNALAQLDLLKAGARREQIDAAQAQADAAQSTADAAEAALGVLDVQISKLTLTSPIDGIVLQRLAEPGQVVLPGGALATIADLDQLRITVYVPEDRYGWISLGQGAKVTVDSFPGASFDGRVVHIADQAEFTPRNVQTAEGRKTTVYAVRLSVENPDGRLKPGMPADVTFGE